MKICWQKMVFTLNMCLTVSSMSMCLIHHIDAIESLDYDSSYFVTRLHLSLPHHCIVIFHYPEIIMAPPTNSKNQD